MTNKPHRNISLFHLILPIIFLITFIFYGLIIRPIFYEKSAFPLEIIFSLSAIFSTAHLIFIGYKWKAIQKAIIDKILKGFPAILILFAIGIIIGSWIISGTIPMMLYYGIKLINPHYIYLLAFVIPIIFSTVTGTSWGSVGTIGTVIIGVAIIIGADLGITAGAIVGGAIFGDKMSPLSDTTNLAAMASEVDLYGHIKSMTYTTLPSAVIALIVFFGLGFIYPPTLTEITSPETTEILHNLSLMFNFNVFLLLPPLIVLYGSLKRKATLPTLVMSAIVACLLALLFQDFGMTNVIMTLKDGFNTDMASWIINTPVQLIMLLNRGGLFELVEVIVFVIMALAFIGTMDVTNAVSQIVNRLFSFIITRRGIILASLASTGFTNAITCNQSAVSFIIGDAFKNLYDKFNISRYVLSRSIEDYGTVLEPLVPWSTTVLFMSATLGVAYEDYYYWQIFSICNIIVAPLFAIFGIGSQSTNTILEEGPNIGDR
ncbi:Na+/H+ antiporter NhaC [Arenibacter sp. ARW7G5Y1]|uniref:Na+/H+ antiporter NhaC n=1 Tax=Arenibacter sp. ARW7G5Y1 TaxID=2135619 RepID=UPI000D756015|nr:Na+/H+ antiporter NhaC [Arenibacter sp. ARW7G5Y1]PXX25488.1 transporter (NhaC family) [Arenibacter sp. ARW7G5Y1]